MQLYLVFFGVIQLLFFFYFFVFCTGDEVVIIHKIIKTNLSMDKNKWK
jgi:hypothetical protein